MKASSTKKKWFETEAYSCNKIWINNFLNRQKNSWYFCVIRKSLFLW